MNGCCDAKEASMILVGVIHAGYHADPKDAGLARNCRNGGLEGFGGQGVSDYDEVFAVQASFGQPLRSGFGIANHGVTQTECGGLGAELSGGQQVAELALAADNHGHTRQPGSWD
jgi:hypothetical protein